MILKYYCDGWNYIDNIENVKWINVDLPEIYKQSGNAIVRETDNIVPSMYNCLYKGIFEKINEKSCTIIDINLQVDDVNNIIKMFNKEDVRCERGRYPEYARVICYSRKSNRKAVCYLGTSFLLNDEGQTIEKIG